MGSDGSLPAGPPLGSRISTWRSIRALFPWMPAFWGADHYVRLSAPPGGIDGIFGWGYKDTATVSRVVARVRGLPYWTGEDGFLRSVRLGKAGGRAWSVSFDDLGVYYDASRPSRLERIIADGRARPLASRGEALRRQIARRRVSKYNHAPDRPVDLAPSTRRTILVVDQVAGDLSIRHALADGSSFRHMMEDARGSGARIALRAHPDVVAGHASGNLLERGGPDHGVEVLAEAVSPHAVLDRVDEVWTVSSQLGFDALLRGIPVRCYGMPFYAGWGLTEDRAEGPAAAAALKRRAARPAVDELAAAALILHPRYVDPHTGRLITAEEAVDGLADARDAEG